MYLWREQARRLFVLPIQVQGSTLGLNAMLLSRGPARAEAGLVKLQGPGDDWESESWRCQDK